MRNEDERHILPGGRRERGETLEETVRREVFEESGWALGLMHRLGFSHFYHLSPMPDDHPFPHPDFFTLNHWAEAEDYHPELRVSDDYEREAAFVPWEEMIQIPLSNGERLFLQAAVQMRTAHSTSR